MLWIKTTSLWVPAALLLALGVSPLAAQYETAEDAGIEMQFDELEEKADQVVKVNLWGKSLEQGKKLLGLRKSVTSPVGRFLGSLKGVYRRTYRFGNTKTEQEDVEPIYQQLADDGWVPLIETEDRSSEGSVSVYSYYENEEVAGLTLVSTDPSEVTVVRIMGAVDLDMLSEIGKGLGLPVMNLGTTDLGIKKVDLPTPK
jgi:hypothetical protein